jgi:predicted esterase
MPKTFAILFIFISLTSIFAQENALQKAFNFHGQKDYCNALENFEKAMQTQELANYPMYYAAQSACQCNKPEAAFNYFVKAFAKTQDFYNYEYFANDKLNGCFSNTPEWKKTLGEMKVKFEAFTTASNKYQKAINDANLRLNFDEKANKNLMTKLQKLSPEKLVKFIKNYKNFQTPPKLNHWTLYNLKNSNGKDIPFLLYIPKNYRPSEPKSLAVFLHGGVSYRNKFATQTFIPDFEKASLKSLQEKDIFIIYPFAKKDFNWLDTADCFETLSRQIRFAKSIFNLDDNRVFIGGHSDGATGSFWFAVNNRTDFAAFFGFAQMPKTFLGKAFIRNLANEQKLFSLNGEKDDLFPFAPISKANEQAKSANANWKLASIKNGGHNFMGDFPNQVNEFYAELLREKRNPLPTNLFWQTDSENSKANYWLKITKLSSSEPAKVTAKYAANVFSIESTGAKELQILIPFGLIDDKKEVRILANGKEVFKSKIKMDKNVIIEDFIANRDRQFLVTKKINVFVE